MIATVVVGDGRRPYLSQALASWESCVTNASDYLIMANDEANSDYCDQLDAELPDWHLIHTGRVGLAGALCSAWCAALDTDFDYLLHCEEDFVFQSPVNALELAAILERQPHLAQISLKRQPVNGHEESMGGYIQCAPNAYWQREGFIEHHVVFTFNPSLIPRRVVELCLDQPGDGLERGFTDTLLDHGFSFGIFGQINDAPIVNHVGVQRSQSWRL